MPMVTCHTCGKKIHKYPSEIRERNYCSRECYQKSLSGNNNPNWKGGKTIVRCEWCGKEYKVKPYLAEGTRFCSVECYARWESKYSRGKNSPTWKGGKTIRKVCPQCGKEFFVWPSSSSQKYCSIECKKQSHYVVSVCPQCGRKFKTRNHNKIYCSKKCQYEAQKKAVVKRCEWCGKPMELLPCIAKIRRFCSVDCKIKWFGSGIVRGENNPRWKGGKITVYCKQCGKPYEIPRDRIDISSFCSNECHYEWQKTGFVGSLNPHWNGGKIGYRGENWQQQRRKALKRDDYTCQICGEEGDNVHHIIPFKEFGVKNYKEANRLSNLMTLCASCHQQYENKITVIISFPQLLTPILFC